VLTCGTNNANNPIERGERTSVETKEDDAQQPKRSRGEEVSVSPQE
jgi:hypothetical protein